MVSILTSLRDHAMFRTKSISRLMSHCSGDHALHRVIGPGELILLGIGAVVGTGIFVITSR